jgi:hypothetical protein
VVSGPSQKRIRAWQGRAAWTLPPSGRSRTDNSCKCNVPATGTAALGYSPRNMILGEMKRAPFAEHYEGLPIGTRVPIRVRDTPQLRSGATLCGLIETEREGS